MSRTPVASLSPVVLDRVLAPHNKGMSHAGVGSETTFALPEWLCLRLQTPDVANMSEARVALGLIRDQVACNLSANDSCGYDGCGCAEALAGAFAAVIDGANTCPDDCTPVDFERALAIIGFVRALKVSSFA